MADGERQVASEGAAIAIADLAAGDAIADFAEEDEEDSEGEDIESSTTDVSTPSDMSWEEIATYDVIIEEEEALGVLAGPHIGDGEESEDVSSVQSDASFYLAPALQHCEESSCSEAPAPVDALQHCEESSCSEALCILGVSSSSTVECGSSSASASEALGTDAYALPKLREEAQPAAAAATSKSRPPEAQPPRSGCGRTTSFLLTTCCVLVVALKSYEFWIVWQLMTREDAQPILPWERGLEEPHLGKSMAASIQEQRSSTTSTPEEPMSTIREQEKTVKALLATIKEQDGAISDLRDKLLSADSRANHYQSQLEQISSCKDYSDDLLRELRSCQREQRQRIEAEEKERQTNQKAEESRTTELPPKRKDSKEAKHKQKTSKHKEKARGEAQGEEKGEAKQKGKHKEKPSKRKEKLRVNVQRAKKKLDEKARKAAGWVKKQEVQAQAFVDRFLRKGSAAIPTSSGMKSLWHQPWSSFFRADPFHDTSEL